MVASARRNTSGLRSIPPHITRYLLPRRQGRLRQLQTMFLVSNPADVESPESLFVK